ncbi:hypothetical protein LF887_10905 [Chryseobacterium sp. MEBOG06]|nr:hypothetical protein [Chryseobacterium sp. MEBOG06]UKB86104.1 hypothetical protein LF887_10905 [Chryseobacterium sp. MEBOG06]
MVLLFYFVCENKTTAFTDYLDGFQYTEGSLKFFPASEGCFNFENNKYIYNYTDHLGNVRLSYFNNGSGIEVLEENNYYPFGLKHEGYTPLLGNLAYRFSKWTINTISGDG